MSLEEFVRGLPKAELHVHIEGTLEPELMLRLAERNRVELPYTTVDEVKTAYRFTDLQSFLDIYYRAASVLVGEDDFYDLMTEYLRRAAADGVRRAEIFFDPQTHTGRGVGFSVFMPGFLRAIYDAEAESGISAALVMCFVRHLLGEAALATLEEARPYLDRILAVGLDSSEVGYPPELFVDAFRMAGGLGLRRVAHVGEEGPPEYVWSALNLLGVERIDHGVRSEEDERLMQRLVDQQVPLTVCPLSNLALKGVQRLEDHNLKRMLERGVKVTINSDDPAYFGGYIGDNYLRTAEALGLTRADLGRIAGNSLEATFAPDPRKRVWLDELEAHVRMWSGD